MIQNQFPHVHISTIGIDKRSKKIEVDGKQVCVQVWDTAGQERYNSISAR